MDRIVAVDWGTTTLRGALLDAAGEALEERNFPRGIMTVEPGGFRPVFDECFGDWMREAPLALVCGMAGSRQGWMEAPYCACPAGFAEIAAQLAWIEPGRIAVVPGVSFDEGGVPDVMRGEETQVLGALQVLGLKHATLVLPGTHSKWVRVKGGRIASFQTFMTGEFYGLLRQHSILARGMPAQADLFDDGAFRLGLAQAMQSASLLQSAFSARTLGLFDRLAAERLPSYLSGLVIGEELRAHASRETGIVIVAGPGLADRYETALQAWGASQLQRVGAEAAWRGLHAIARTIRR